MKKIKEKRKKRNKKKKDFDVTHKINYYFASQTQKRNIAKKCSREITQLYFGKKYAKFVISV